MILENLTENTQLKTFLDGLVRVLGPHEFLKKPVRNLLGLVKTFEDGERVSIYLQFGLESELGLEFVVSSLKEANSYFKQRHEEVFLGYLVRKFSTHGREFMVASQEDVGLFKLLIPIASRVESGDVMLEVLPTLRLEGASFLLLEIEVNYLLIYRFKRSAGEEYLKALYERIFRQENDIEVHREGLRLFGLSPVEACTKAVVDMLVKKYYPLRVRELVQGSVQESNFKAIIRGGMDMIKLSRNMELLSLVFPLFKERLDRQWEKELKQFVRELAGGSSTLQELSHVMALVWDRSLDRSHDDNLRFGLFRKLLVVMLENSDVVDFMCKYGTHLEQELNKGLKEADWDAVVLYLNEQIVVMDTLCIMYQKVDDQVIRNTIHKQLFGAGSQGNELTKKVILHCGKIRKQRFDKLWVLEEGKKNLDHAHFDLDHLLQDYYSANYNLLIYCMIRTQTKENLFLQQLFASKPGEQPWHQLVIPDQLDFGFEIETKFKEIDFKRNNLIQDHTNIKDQIA